MIYGAVELHALEIGLSAIEHVCLNPGCNRQARLKDTLALHTNILRDLNFVSKRITFML